MNFGKLKSLLVVLILHSIWGEGVLIVEAFLTGETGTRLREAKCAYEPVPNQGKMGEYWFSVQKRSHLDGGC